MASVLSARAWDKGGIGGRLGSASLSGIAASFARPAPDLPVGIAGGASTTRALCTVEIQPEDLVIDVYRSPLNDRAVKITHLPSGVSVSSDDRPTREQNHAVAMQLLRAALDA